MSSVIPAGATAAVTPQSWQHRAWAWAALALWWAWSLGLRPLALPDEGRYGGIARDMLVYGDIWVPRLNGLPFFHKPPLFYWIDAAGMTLFGASAATTRIASALAAWLACAAVFVHARRVRGELAAHTAVLVLATQPLYFLAGQYANMDMLVAALITLTIVAWAHAVDGGVHARAWSRLGWSAAALALLAKGLIGLVLPLMVLLPWWVLDVRRRAAPWREPLQRWLDPAGLALAVAIGAPWFVAMGLRFPGFFDYFFIEQHWRRYTGAGFNNPQPAWFYAAALAATLLPWSVLLPAAVRARLKARPIDRWTLLWLWWAVAIIAFFSLPRSKLIGYVLPAVPPLALLIGTWISTRRRWPLALGVLGAVVCAASVGAVRAWEHKSLREIPHHIQAEAARDAAWRDAQLVFVDSPRTELPLLLDTRQLPWVVSDWADPAIARSDSWRKELRDSARFDPVRAAQVLVPPQRLQARLCDTERAWVVIASGEMPAYPQLAALPVAWRERDTLLLRWPPVAERPAAACQVGEAGH